MDFHEPAVHPLDPRARFQAVKALRYCTGSRPLDAAPYSNSLAIVSAMESQTTLLSYADFRASLVEVSSHKAAKELDALLALPAQPAIATFTAKLKAFRLPEAFVEAWRTPEFTSEWEGWLEAVEAYEGALDGMLQRVASSGRVEALGVLNARVAAAVQRMEEEHAASLVTKLDARALKKRAKAAERERLLREAQEEAEGGGSAAARKHAKKAMKKMGGAEGGGGEAAAAADAAAAEPLSAAMQALLSTAGSVSKKDKKAKGASLPSKAPAATCTASSAAPVPGA